MGDRSGGGNNPLTVFSNCDEVELRLNGTLLERRSADADRLSTHIKHPPLTFQLKRFLQPLGPRDSFAREHCAWFALLEGDKRAAARRLQ